MNLSYVHGATDVPLLGETIGACLDRIAGRYPQGEALVSSHQRIRLTYEELKQACDEFARGLIAFGVQHGDRVGIWATNRVEWVIAQFATPKIGAILVNVNPAYRAGELQHALAQSGTSVLLTQAHFKSSDYLAMVEQVRAKVPSLRTIIVLGDEPASIPPGCGRWSDVRDAALQVSVEELQRRQALTQFDDAINIQYTSGTTGFPKGATLSHHNILNNGFFVGETCRYSELDRVCIPVPFYHCFGMVLGNLACLTHGATIVIPSPSFDPEATLLVAQQERCTSLYGVPAMFIAELEHPNFTAYDLSTLRTGIMGGSPCPAEIMRRVCTEMHASEMAVCYGMTETSPVSFQTRCDDAIEKRTGSVGRVHPHLEVKLVDEARRIVERGTPGALCTRGYSVMLGYWNDLEQTAEAIDPARYMHSGDIAVMDDDGYVTITGRAKDMVIRGGENIYPREIEEFLYTHPAVRDVAVVGVPDQKYGEQLCAWIILREGASASDDEIKNFCRDNIAHYKIPHYVLFVEDFPMTVTGKVQKFKMRELSSAKLGLQPPGKIVCGGS